MNVYAGQVLLRDCDDGGVALDKIELCDLATRNVSIWSGDSIIELHKELAEVGVYRATIVLPDMHIKGEAIILSLLADEIEYHDPRDEFGPGECFVVAAGRGNEVMSIDAIVNGCELRWVGADTNGSVPRDIGCCMDVEGWAQKVDELSQFAVTSVSLAARSYRDICNINKEEFDAMFPEISPSMYTFVHKAYRSGLCAIGADWKLGHDERGARKAFAAISAGDVIMNEDVSSAYLYCLAVEALPCGMPVASGEGEPPTDMLWIGEVEFEFFLRDPIHIPPFIADNEMAAQGGYLKDSEDHIAVVSSVEWETINKYYVVDVLRWGEWIAFDQLDARAQLRLLGNPAADMFVKKEYAKGICKKPIKNMINGLVGQFARRPRFEDRIPEIRFDGTITWKTVMKNKPQNARYLPVAVFVVAYQQAKLLQRIELRPEWLYCDTDGIYFLGRSLEQDSSSDRGLCRFGAWRMTSVGNILVVWGPKAYVVGGGGWVACVHCAGVPELSPPPTMYSILQGGYFEFKTETVRHVPGGIRAMYERRFWRNGAILETCSSDRTAKLVQLVDV